MKNTVLVTLMVLFTASLTLATPNNSQNILDDTVPDLLTMNGQQIINAPTMSQKSNRSSAFIDSPFASLSIGEAFTGLNSGTFKGILHYQSFFRNDGPGERRDIEKKPVPEPATLLLFGSGLVGLMSLARRKTG